MYYDIDRENKNIVICVSDDSITYCTISLLHLIILPVFYMAEKLVFIE